jgi:hypothetical protein
VNDHPLKSRKCRPRVIVRVAVVVLTAVVCGTMELAGALDCEGRLVSEGQAPWKVQAICGEPTQVQDTVKIKGLCITRQWSTTRWKTTATSTAWAGWKPRARA